MEKEKMYKRIKEMNLNTSNEEVLEILKFVNDTYLYEEEFYNNLYALIEKEKYFAKRFNIEPTLYPKLDSKTKIVLERIFVKGLKEYDDDELYDTVEKLKNSWYISILDKKYEKFFDTCEIVNEQTYDIEEGKCCTYWDDTLSYEKNKMYFVFSDRQDLHLNPRDYYTGERHYRFRNVQNRIETDPDYYFVRVYKFGDIPFDYAIDRNTGKRRKLPSSNGFPDFELGHFVFSHKNSSNESSTYIFYDEDLKNKIKKKNVKNVYYDHKLRHFLILYDNNRLFEYNDRLFIIRPIDFERIYGKHRIISVNDGVIVLELPNKKVLYYDYDKMKEIDSFRHPYRDIDEDTFIYNDGLYNYADTNGKIGYKDIEGKVVIKPIYQTALPFLNGIARVYIEVEKVDNKGKKFYKNESVYIDRTGKQISFGDICKSIEKNRIKHYKSINVDGAHLCYDYYSSSFILENLHLFRNLKSNRYQLIRHFGDFDRFEGNLITLDNYVVKNDTPISEIDFNVKREELIKVKK